MTFFDILLTLLNGAGYTLLVTIACAGTGLAVGRAASRAPPTTPPPTHPRGGAR